ncbi:MAG: DMT family transporter [Croceitalea sp.]|nr:DMT family transporter [Croceitalea sp.]NNL08592.1 DMT family transporter [Croceitalea sp.]
MLYLALSVLCSSFIFVIFKLFEVYKVQTLYAIITNYVVACSVGLVFYQEPLEPTQIMANSWFYGTLALGVLFILIFNIMAKTSQQIGVSVASVATKMSLVIPVVFGVFVYGEILSTLKVLGILLALAAVYFASMKERSINLSKASLVLPLLVFLGSGIIDTSIKWMQETQLSQAEYPIFSAVVFAAAAVMGILFILFKSLKTPIRLNFRNVLGGIALGVPNYFSIYFLLKALENDQWNSASIFTINNVAIVMFSTLLGILLFKEQLSLKNWVGIIMAVVSILLVALY